MRYFSCLTAIAVAGLLALPALAEPPKERGARGERPGREQMREQMLKKFDKDGDGKLSNEERQAAREAMRERLGRRGPEGGRRPEGRRGTDRPDRAAGTPPRLAALFDKFDADGDGKLSRKEFAKLADFVRSHRPGPPPGERLDGRRPDGPPPRGEGFRPRRPGFEDPPRGERRPDRERRRPRSEQPAAETQDKPDEAI